MGLISKLAAVGVGYLLGARAGQDRYQQIVRLSQQAAASPQLQAAQAQLRDLPALARRAWSGTTAAAKKTADGATTAAGAPPAAGVGVVGDSAGPVAPVVAGGPAAPASADPLPAEPPAAPAPPLTGRQLRRSTQRSAGPAAADL